MEQTDTRSESRFQRWRSSGFLILGRCPRLAVNAAPLALTRNPSCLPLHFSQYWARSWFSLLPLDLDKELLDSRKLIWLLVTAYLLGPPGPCSLCSCAMAPMLKAAKAIAVAAATFASIDNFIWQIAR